MRYHLLGLAIFLTCFYIPDQVVHAAEAPHIVMFSPQGTVKNIRQVQVRFSESMVPFGNPRGGMIEPFTIECPVQGTPRWVDDRNWVYDFARDLPTGIRCLFTVKSDLQTLAGQDLTGTKAFTFSTGGPAIITSIPFEGAQSIDEEQIFILTLDGEPTEESVHSSVSFAIEGIYEPVGIRIISGEEKNQILRAYYQYSTPPSAPQILIQAKQRFPANALVRLIWGRGIRSPSGVATEKEQILTFKTRAPFTATLQCQRENPQRACIPLRPLHLQFSAAVSRNQANAIVLKGPEGKTWKPEGNENADAQDFVYTVTFNGPFPEQSELLLEVPADLTDDAGRTLANAGQFPLKVRTEAYPPLAKFAARFGILEWKADPVLPVTVRNIEPEIKAEILETSEERAGGSQSPDPTEIIPGRLLKISSAQSLEILSWLQKIYERTWEDRAISIFEGIHPEKKLQMFSIPKPHGGKAFEVVGIPLRRPGFYVIELESSLLGASLLGKSTSMFVPTTALVTNLSVHFKWGKARSLVWVTTLANAQPVPDAWVVVQDCTGAIVSEGPTDAQGILYLDTLPAENEIPQCTNYPLGGGLFVTAQTAEDMAFVHSSWDEGIEPWRFQLPYPSYQGPTVAHTILDRSLLRAGETVHMKHVLRTQTMNGFGLVSQTEWPQTVIIQHVGSNQQYEYPLQWDTAIGVAETTWKIPREAKLGTYTIVLLKEGEEIWNGLQSGQFRVEEFRVPLMKGSIQFSPEPLIAPSTITLDLMVEYLAGGGASLLPVTLRYQLQPRSVESFAGFEDFVFANGPVKEGLFQEGTEQVEERQSSLQSLNLALDQAGATRTTVTNLPEINIPMDMLTELEFRDPNGEIQTVSSRIPLWPSKWLIGIHQEDWAATKESFTFQVGVVDVSGKPISQAPVTVELFQRKTYSHRKRLVGGFYAYEHFSDTRRIDTICTGSTDGRGLLICATTSPVSGNVLLQATTTDETGQKSVTHREIWIAGTEDWWFAVGDHDRMDILPEQKQYEPGETAKVQIRMPFREATALVTVEREGIMNASVIPLSGKKPVLTLPVQGEYAPNVFISVLAVRGRVSSIQPTTLVDLGRPAFKLGITEIKVGWKAYQLQVTVSPDRQVYRVREKARVQVTVRTAAGGIPPAGGEIALAAVDEGLLELFPNTSWQILPAMMTRRGYAIRTATVQMHVIGKRHFGLKALPQGGGGGKQITRELFDTLLLWKGRVPLDANGETMVEIPLNDSLTSFRIVAVALSGVSLFGTGSTSVRSTQDLMLLSGIAPLVREGDRYWSEVTLRNTTERSMEVIVSAQVEGLSAPLPSLTISLAPGEAKSSGWDITAPFGVDSLRYTIEAQESGGSSDRIIITQRVIPAVPIRPFQATLTQLDPEIHLPIERPAAALPGQGGIEISLHPRLGHSLNGVRDYMRHYPYTCLEQKISQAVALQNEALWEALISILPAHLDPDGLAKYFPSMQQGSDVLTSYLLAIAHEAQWPIPENLQEKMEYGLRGFIEGSLIRYSALPTADLALRKLAAIEALSRFGKAERHWLASIAILPNLWPTSAVIDWFNILQRMPDIADRDQKIEEAEQILRSRLHLQGTTMGFSTELSDDLWWLMISPDLNAVRLILSLLAAGKWKEEMPRLVRGALGRQKRGAWDLTVANAWGVLALEKFSQLFEQTPVSGISTVTLNGQSHRIDWSATPQGDRLLLAWPSQPEELIVRSIGTGKPWITVQSLAAIPLTHPLSSGYTIRKAWIPIEQKRAGLWSRGDVVRIRLHLEAQADMTWVVVSDPIPAGSTILGTGLGRDSLFVTQGEEQTGWVWPAFEERSLEAFRVYYTYVPKGEWSVEYTIRLHNEGVFQLPPTRVEAMYAPEMFGERPNHTLTVHK